MARRWLVECIELHNVPRSALSRVIKEFITRDKVPRNTPWEIWQAILEFVATVTEVFSIADEEVLDALVDESDELAHICELYQCKMTS